MSFWRPPDRPDGESGTALYPTATATTVRVKGGKGGDVVASDGPYAETKEAPHRLLHPGVRRPGRGRRRCRPVPAAWNGAVEVRPVFESRPVAPAPDPAREALVRVVRDEGRRVLATLARTVGDVGLAEDAVQDAVARALQAWRGTASRPARGPG